MTFGRKLVAIVICLCMTVPAMAETAEITILSAVEQARAEELFKRIKCPICSGQSIAESDIEISKTLRAYIVEEIKAGASDNEIELMLIDAYGESILLEPRFNPSNALLWFTPGFLLCIAGFLLWRLFSEPMKKGNASC